MKKYFIHDDTNQTGPFDKQELKNLHTSKNTAVWFGLDGWKKISDVKELSDTYSIVPPPFQAEQKPVNPIRQRSQI
jgi:hypothetical protein